VLKTQLVSGLAARARRDQEARLSLNQNGQAAHRQHAAITRRASHRARMGIVDHHGPVDLSRLKPA
jgi:hypothetical protein